MRNDILEQIYLAAVVEGASLNELRGRFGGKDVYLRQTDRDNQRLRIIADLKCSSPDVVAKRHGISRATAYRFRKLG